VKCVAASDPGAGGSPPPVRQPGTYCCSKRGQVFTFWPSRHADPLRFAASGHSTAAQPPAMGHHRPIPTREDTPMGDRGPAPKDSARRRRTNSDAATSLPLAADGRVRGPQLPKDVLPNGEVWHSQTAKWWANWRRSAQATTFTATDWDFLVDTALMHHTMWSKGRWEFAAEIRLRVAKFGATAEDRQRLRMSLEGPDRAGGDRHPLPEGATSIDSIRARLAAL
jgi:hypothetical protein